MNIEQERENAERELRHINGENPGPKDTSGCLPMVIIGIIIFVALALSQCTAIKTALYIMLFQY